MASGAAAASAVSWDTSMLPAQKDMAVQAVVRFKVDTNLVFLTAATAGLEIPERPTAKIVLFAPHDLPDHFWPKHGGQLPCRGDVDFARPNEAYHDHVARVIGLAEELQLLIVLSQPWLTPARLARRGTHPSGRGMTRLSRGRERQGGFLLGHRRSLTEVSLSVGVRTRRSRDAAGRVRSARGRLDARCAVLR
jgi:hypothetical protein